MEAFSGLAQPRAAELLGVVLALCSAPRRVFGFRIRLCLLGLKSKNPWSEGQSCLEQQLTAAFSPWQPVSTNFGCRYPDGPSPGWVSVSRLERAIGKGHRRPLCISVTQSLPGGWQEGADISPLPNSPRAGGKARPGKGTQLRPGGCSGLPGAAGMMQGFRPNRWWGDRVAPESSPWGCSPAHPT